MGSPVKTPANWLAKVANPFGLRVPPLWWLQELYVFDPDLVLFPSQQSFHYRLCRKARRSHGILSALSNGTDAAVCVAEKLVPVTSLGGTVAFNASIMQWLVDRDTWRHGGAKEANRILDEQEQAAEASKLRDRDAENDARAHSSYRTYVRRVGASVALSDINRGRGRMSRSRPITRTGSAPVPPTVSAPAPSGWGSSASGLVTPPTP